MNKGEKQKFSFVFNNLTYTGYVVSSMDIEPHFHWFMFEDQDTIAKYGDSIAFKVEKGKLIPVYHLTSPLFVAAVQECVQQYLDKLSKSKDPRTV